MTEEQKQSRITNAVNFIRSWTNTPTIHEAVLDAEADKGLYAHYTDSPKIKHYKVDSLVDYYNAYLNDDLVRAMVDDLVESALGNGMYTVAQNLSEKTKHNKTKELVDEYGKHFRLDDFMPNVIRNSLIAGFCPVETVISKSGKGYKDFGKCRLKIIRPDTIDTRQDKGIIADTSTFPPKILKVYQKVGTKEEVITASGDKTIAWFCYGQLGNDVRGVSFVRGILNLLNTLNDATEDVQKILKRYIAPIGIWKGEQNTEAIKTAVVNRNAGEDIFLGSLTPEEMASGVVEFHTIDPRVPFWDYLEYLDRRIWNYSRAANMYYMREANAASIEGGLGDVIRRHVTAIQRFTKRGMENYWFIPLVASFQGDKTKYDDIDLRFGVEKTQVEDIQLEGMLAAGIRYNYIPRSLYFRMLKQLGLDLQITPAELAELEKDAQTLARNPPEQTNPQKQDTQVKPGQDKPEQHKEPHFVESNRWFFLKQCMDCGNTVMQSVVWEKKADGLVYYAWFCDECLSDWIQRREKAGDKIISIRPVVDGKVDEEFSSYYSGYEAMPRHRVLGSPLMKFNAKITGDTIEGELRDIQHEYPKKRYTVIDYGKQKEEEK